MSKVVNIERCFGLFEDTFSPKIVGELNGQHVKLVRVEGDKVPWHTHENEDEMFLVVSGSFDMLFRERSVTVEEGEFIIVPRGVEHCPSARREVHVLLFEPTGTVNTGDAGGDKTVSHPDWI